MATQRTAAVGTEWLRNQTKRIGEGPELPVPEAQASTIEVEGWLQRHGVEYAPAGSIPMALIDERRSRHNQARKDPILPDSVDRFATAMKAGAAFPPIVCYPASGRLIIIDGNNRQAAARKANLNTIHGIIIAEDTPGELIQLLTVEANAHHGVTPDLSWRLRQAFHLASVGYIDSQAAEAAGVNLAQMRTARAVSEADARARLLKVSGFNELSTAARQSLGTIRDDAVFSHAARLAVSTAMTGDEIRDMVRALKPMGSEAARIDLVAQIATERGVQAAQRKALGARANRVSSPKTGLVTGIGLVLKVDPSALLRQVVTVHDRDLLKTRLKALEEKFHELSVALDTLDLAS